MKTIFIFLTFFSFFQVVFGQETGEVCLNLPHRGLDTIKLEKICKKGDIIQTNKRYVGYLCDFNYSIANYGDSNNFICVYLGDRRSLREGSTE